jgi:hypothetical protein
VSKKKATPPQGIAQVSVSGPAMAIQSLADIEGMTLVEHTDRQRGPDEWVVTAYATPGAMREAQARGCTLNIIMTAEALLAHQKKVFAQVERPKPAGRKGGW